MKLEINNRMKTRKFTIPGINQHTPEQPRLKEENKQNSKVYLEKTKKTNDVPQSLHFSPQGIRMRGNPVSKGSRRKEITTIREEINTDEKNMGKMNEPKRWL